MEGRGGDDAVSLTLVVGGWRIASSVLGGWRVLSEGARDSAVVGDGPSSICVGPGEGDRSSESPSETKGSHWAGDDAFSSGSVSTMARAAVTSGGGPLYSLSL